MEEHIHGWKKYGLAKSEKFLCCTSPNCYVVRNWKFIVGRFAICPTCFEKFIVLGYQNGQRVLNCHKCAEHRLTETESLLIKRLTEESEKPVSVSVFSPRDLAKQIASFILSSPVVNKKDEMNTPSEIDEIILPDEQITEDGKLETKLTPEQEETLRVNLEKKLQGILEGK